MKRKETESPKESVATAQSPGRLFVPIDKVRPDPNQPRKMFDEAKLKELAESIKEQGIIQDLLVTYHPPSLRIREPDLTQEQWTVLNEKNEVEFAGNENNCHLYAGEHNLVDHYQIIDGERRWRAARLAGMEAVPVAVRVIEDKTKLALQVVANQQRENLTALEEAEAYRKEIDSGRHTPDTLYKSLGISRGTLFSRLALNKLSQPVRDALLKGDISLSVAGLAAMIPDVKQQEKFCQDVGPDEWNGPVSFREAQDRLQEDYCRQLKDAPFDRETVYEGSFKIISKDGKPSPVTLRRAGTCKDCKYRTGNMEGTEFKNPNVCTQPRCFEAKAETAAATIIAAAQAKGAKVLSEKESRKVFSSYSPTEPVYNSGYTKLNEHCYETASGKTYKELLGKDAPDPVLALNPEGKLIPVYSKAALTEALKKKGVKLSSQGSTSSYGEQEKKRKEKQKRLLVVAERALPILLEKVRTEPLTKLFQLMALKFCWERSYLERHGLRMEGNSMKALKEHVEKLSKMELTPVAVAEAVWCLDLVEPWQAQFGHEFKSICDAYKVDLDKVAATVKAEAKKNGKPEPAKSKGKK